MSRNPRAEIRASRVRAAAASILPAAFLSVALVMGTAGLSRADDLDVLDGFDDDGGVYSDVLEFDETETEGDALILEAGGDAAGNDFFAVATSLSPAACAEVGLERPAIDAAYSALADPPYWARAVPVSFRGCSAIGFSESAVVVAGSRGGLNGFDDDDAAASFAGGAFSADSSFIAISGSVALGASYNYAQKGPEDGAADYRGLSRARGDLKLQADVELPAGFQARVQVRGFRDVAYALKDRDEFTDPVLDLYESEVELQEAYVQGSLLPSLDVKLGRQVLVWGNSDTVRVLDVLNPIDNREPGLVDLEDLRLPVTMSRLDYYVGPLQITGVAVHETRFSKQPVFGSDFFPFPTDLPGEDLPANGGNDTEYGVQIAGRFDDLDLTLNAARYFEDDAFVDESFRRQHSRVTLLGGSGQYVAGNWLLKAEYARIDGLEFFATPGDDFTRNDFLLGAEYGGFTDVQLSAEVAVRQLQGFTSLLANPVDRQRRNRVESSARYTQFFFNQTLRVTALAVVLGERAEEGAILRLSADYTLRDAVTAGFGVLVFQGGDIIDPFDKNDRVFASLKYSF